VSEIPYMMENTPEEFERVRKLAIPDPGETLARMFHEKYERLAPEFGYKTREASAVPWDDVPADNKALMVAVCTEIVDEIFPQRYMLGMHQ